MIQQTIDETIKALSKLGYWHLNVTFSVETLPKGTAGLAMPQHNHIKISREYYAAFPEEIIARTIPHEVVHLYVSEYHPDFKQAHGKEFRKIMQALGKDPSTYHSMNLEGMERTKRKVTRFVYVTSVGERVGLTKAQHTKALAGSVFTNKSGEVLEYRGEEFYDFICLFK